MSEQSQNGSFESHQGAVDQVEAIKDYFSESFLNRDTGVLIIDADIDWLSSVREICEKGYAVAREAALGEAVEDDEPQAWALEKAGYLKMVFERAFKHAGSNVLIIDPDGMWLEEIRCAIQEAYWAGLASGTDPNVI